MEEEIIGRILGEEMLEEEMLEDKML